MKQLIALVAIAAATYGPDQPAIAKGDVIDVPLSDELQAKLIADGVVELADSPAEPKAPAKAAKRIKVRLLVDSALGNCNDVVEVDVGEVKKLEIENLADGGKEAVAYAMTLEQNKP